MMSFLLNENSDIEINNNDQTVHVVINELKCDHGIGIVKSFQKRIDIACEKIWVNFFE